MTQRMRSIGIVILAALLCSSIGTLAVRVLPAVYHLEQRPGTIETHRLTILNDTDSAEELSIYVGDWQRFEDGEHDWAVPINTARWIFDRPFVAGEIVELSYLVQLPSNEGVGIEGTFRSFSPQVEAAIAGQTVINSNSIGNAPIASDAAIVWVGRTIESIDQDGTALVRLVIHCNVDFHGLLIHETTSLRVDFTSVEDAGARFDTINRSNAGWISLSHDRLVLQPNESRDIIMTINMPAGISGSYWAAVFVQSQPQAADEGGTRVISIFRTAIKVFVTAFGTDMPAGRVIDVQVGKTDPLVLYALFENTGNVELVVIGEMQVIDRTGNIVLDLMIDEFKVLPGAKRIVTIIDTSESGPLPADIYQAVISFDYGGNNPVVGVRGFRIR